MDLFNQLLTLLFKKDVMNKCTLFTVFLSGAVFSILLSLLHKSLSTIKDQTINNISQSIIGILPAGVDLELMDDGYIAMESMGHLLADEDEDPDELSKTNKQRSGTTTKQSTEIEERNSEIEALNSLKAARELIKIGKSARAGRLIEHAYSLLPWNPDILICYGEYLEDHQNNVIQADHMYLKALAVSPTNSRALRNRRRTQKVVEELDIIKLAEIDQKQEQLMMIPRWSGALRRIKKEAYFQYIYHTAAIEGNTFTLEETRMVLETRLGIAGKSILEHNEILGLDLALKYINMTLVNRGTNITLNTLLQIHRRVLGHSNPLDAGELRTTQVYVSNHIPPPPSKVQVLMENFILWLNSKEARQLHPIKHAALAHYKLVYIHPFLDGNGRTARLLMNYMLMQAGYPPVIIRKQDRLLYYKHLQTANDGDTRPFIRFIADCADKTLDVYLWATQEHFPELEQQPSSQSEHLDPVMHVSSLPHVPNYDNTDDVKETDNVYTDVNNGDSWLHGKDLDDAMTGKEYIQLKHYRTNMKENKMKSPMFLFDADDELDQYSSRGR